MQSKQQQKQFFNLIKLPMNILKSALGRQTQEDCSNTSQANHSLKSFKTVVDQKWLIDNDENQDVGESQKQTPIGPCGVNKMQDTNHSFSFVVKNVVQKQFTNQKYLEQLYQYLLDVPTQLAKLSKIQEVITELADEYLGQIKNYIKNVQSLLDVRIRKIKRKQKKNQLSEFDKIVHEKNLMKKKCDVMYIDEDNDEKKHLQRKQSRIKHGKIFEAESKKSYGTMNSGSKENSSGQKSGSQSRSGQGKALAVLLGNMNHNRQDEKKSEKSESINQSYDFSSVMSSSVSVKQRGNRKQNTLVKQASKNNKAIETIRNKNSQTCIKDSDQKDKGFIFHRPKKSKRLKF